MTTEKLVVCDPACKGTCTQPATSEKVRLCADYGTDKCTPTSCCPNEHTGCVLASVEQIASAKLRGSDMITHVVCDSACKKGCHREHDVDMVRSCASFGTSECHYDECCSVSGKVCIPATPEQIASARLRGLI